MKEKMSIKILNWQTDRGQAIRLRSGQATLELTVALILIVILLMAGVKVFLWLNEGLVHRQVSYENTRVAAGNTSPETVSLDAYLDNVEPQDLVIRGANGGTEVDFNEPFNATFNIFATSN
ncbi:MAG: hypothetical protein AUJ74_01025 [Candidatus Omnitrophica bacterium CG1_02_44_16]|nr:MAG: hypothetical protein AUJ74_01025 [Candidatus Omnitrophica bacterium CG1_02_44_16]PIY82665.1 MAG: hypothetical protein COY78_05180 [Candidatus Omnitrophica bacterium CG_4_10_14_0_8_um_filter_44_12]PIZ84117.1 MAG: hypothetical protein COX96_05455 [Candidatus Omnitrophica bacterium CG_4_10_14_0_2_um_filter_44_9]